MRERDNDVDVRRTEAGTYWASSPSAPVHGHGDTFEEALYSFEVELQRWKHGREILAGEPT